MQAIESEGLKYVDVNTDCTPRDIEDCPYTVKAWSASRRVRVKYFDELIEYAVSDLAES